MSNIFLISVILINLLALFFIYFLFKKELELKFKEKEKLDIKENINALEALSNLFQELRKEIYEALSRSIEKTAKIEEVARVLEFYSSDLRSLKEILAGTKTKGYLGERSLEEILKELPTSFYEKQYSIGLNRVDFVLKINDSIIPIDAKFSYSSYAKLLSEENEIEKNRLKKELIKAIINHIKTIYSKYIEPLRGTTEYAIMYIPAEGLFYEILSDKDYEEIWNFAREKAVILASPKTFEILISQLSILLKKQEFSRNLQSIFASILQLEKDIIEIFSLLEKAKNQMNMSRNNLEEAYRAFNKFMFNFKDLIKKELNLKEENKEKVKTLL